MCVQFINTLTLKDGLSLKIKKSHHSSYDMKVCPWEDIDN